MSGFKAVWIIYNLSGKMQQLEIVWTLRSWVLDVFKNFLLLDATEVKLVAIKVEINLISVYTFSIFREKSL